MELYLHTCSLYWYLVFFIFHVLCLVQCVICYTRFLNELIDMCINVTRT